MADDSGKKHDKGIHYALYQRQGNHVAVSDMTDFVCEHGAHFTFVKASQQPCADSHERIIAIPARRKGIGGV